MTNNAPGKSLGALFVYAPIVFSSDFDAEDASSCDSRGSISDGLRLAETEAL